MGDCDTTTLLRNSRCQSRRPSSAERPATRSRLPEMICRTLPFSSVISEVYCASSVMSLLCHNTLPVSVSNAATAPCSLPGVPNTRAPLDGRRLAVAPAGNLAAQFSERRAPAFRPVRRVRAKQFALGADGDHKTVPHRRRAAWAVAEFVGVKIAEAAWPERSFPSLASRQKSHCAVGVLTQNVDLLADDGRAGIAGAKIRGKPELLRPAFRPGFHQAGFARDIITLRATELRPVVGAVPCHELTQRVRRAVRR